jgi:3',5'-nucleoside bisphosphate phosphatase
MCGGGVWFKGQERLLVGENEGSEKETLMDSLTNNLVLAPDAAIDLQVHTAYSDGTWGPEQLIDHLVSEGFALAAITDHDRADIAPMLQQVAAARQFPLLVAVEMTTSWRGEMTDVLCYGFDFNDSPLHDLSLDVARRQRDNSRQIYDNLVAKGYTFDEIDGQPPDDLLALLELPSAQHPHAMVAFVKKHGHGDENTSAGRLALDAGLAFITTDIDVVVDAAHRSGAVCLIAHPGRGDGFPRFDAAMLDQLRGEVLIDGIEVYYPLHTPEQTALYRDYAAQHDLLTSAGSDSHGPDKPPIKYPAGDSRKLLERLGIQVQ